MVAVVSASGILGGSLLTCLSERYPHYARWIDVSGAACFVLGVALIGAGLPIFR